MRLLLPLVIFLGIAGFLWKALQINPTLLPSALIGKQSPAFRLTTVEDPKKGVTQNLFKNQVTILHVWASWCHTCQRDHSIWMELAKKHKAFIIGVNYHDDLKDAQDWLQKEGNPYFLNLYDKEGRLGMDYGVYGIPETFILDRNGVIRYRHVGPINHSLWQKELFPLIQNLEQHQVT